MITCAPRFSVRTGIIFTHPQTPDPALFRALPLWSPSDIISGSSRPSQNFTGVLSKYRHYATGIIPGHLPYNIRSRSKRRRVLFVIRSSTHLALIGSKFGTNYGRINYEMWAVRLKNGPDWFDQQDTFGYNLSALPTPCSITKALYFYIMKKNIRHESCSQGVGQIIPPASPAPSSWSILISCCANSVGHNADDVIHSQSPLCSRPAPPDAMNWIGA